MEFEFTVLGKAKSKGSWKVVTVNGKNQFVPQVDKGKLWEMAVRESAYSAFCYEGSPRKLIDAPLRVEIVCFFARPKVHYRTGKFSDQLKPDAPHAHTKAPDCDKLARGILDAMTGVVYYDDSQVSELVSKKEWTEGHEHAVFRVRVIEQV